MTFRETWWLMLGGWLVVLVAKSDRDVIKMFQKIISRDVRTEPRTNSVSVNNFLTMKTLLILTVCALAGCSSPESNTVAAGWFCKGRIDCKACVNCSACRHCQNGKGCGKCLKEIACHEDAR